MAAQEPIKTQPAQTSPSQPSSQKPAGSKVILIIFILFLLFILPVAGLFAYKFLKGKGKLTLKPGKAKPTKSVSIAQGQFAQYQEVKVNISPQVASYKVDSNLANVANKKDFAFNEKAQDLLVKNAFVVQPGFQAEFFPLYERNRYSYTPNFITTDSILHNYHLFFSFLLRNIEKDQLSDQLKNLNTLMLDKAQEQYNDLVGTDWENAAKRNLGFFAVGSKLLNPQIQVPQVVKTEVDKELSLIDKHQGIEDSPVINIGSKTGTKIDTPQGRLTLEALKEDYSQYIPRGHYTKTKELKRYFKSMMWYGRLTFRIKSPDEVKSAILITLLLNDNQSQKIWNNIYQVTSFFVGKSDDINYFDFSKLLKTTYGNLPVLKDLTSQKDKFDSFWTAAKKLEPPKINSIPIFQSGIQEDREEEIKGFRFMGQRFTIDASIMQRLVCREVGNKHGTMDCGGTIADSRMLPKGLDIPAAFGSKEALNILNTQGETKYFKYLDNMEKLRDYTADLPLATWTQNLYWNWMYSLLPLSKEVKDGYPSFMTNTAWARKDLNSYLGSWTELKHDTILYAKQVYAELGGGGIEEKDDRGYVEPRPYLYARLASLIKMTKDGLNSRNLITDRDLKSLDKMETLVLSLKEISQKELNNKALTDKEYQLIKTYGGSLEHFWLEAMRDEKVDSPSQTSEHPAALVADVATDPNGQVLEEAIGNINEIFVIFPQDGKLKIGKGGVFSYYEFTWPMSDRLTDEKWREVLSSDEKPDLPEWTNAFFAGFN